MSIRSSASCRLAMPILCALFTGIPGIATAADSPVRLQLTPAGIAQMPDPSLIASLDDWLDKALPWPRRTTPARIRFITDRQARRMAGHPAMGHGRARGLYDAETETIHLVSPWSADNPGDVAVLLHELVHHRQAPHHFYCPAAQEEAAYKAQAAWLAERGLSADINWIAVTLQAGCTPRDIHP